MDDEVMLELGRLHRELVPVLRLYAGGDPGLAEELSQEALVRCWLRWDRIDNHRAWTYRCAINLAGSTFRRRAAERRALRRAAEPDHIDTGTDDVAVDVDLRRAIDALPKRQREAVLLRYLADLPVEDVAVVMDCATGTVKAHVARGLDALRRSSVLADDDLATDDLAPTTKEVTDVRRPA